MDTNKQLPPKVTNILFLGSFPSICILNRYPTKGFDTYKDAEFLIKGFKGQGNVLVDVITAPDIPSWPGFNEFYIKGEKEERGVQIAGFLNVAFIKHIWIALSLFFNASKVIAKNGRKITNVIIPYMVFHHVFAGRLLKLRFGQRVTITTIVQDIFFPSNFILRCSNKLSENMTKKSDSFVLFTEEMSNFLRIYDKPFMIMESIIDPSIVRRGEKQFHDTIIILYTGALHPNHGTMKLFDVMKLIDDQNIELWITGRGQLYDDVKESSSKDPRIKFFGTIEKNKVFEFQTQADILINPRCNDDSEEIAKYMFPSKVVEYMLSGNPAVVCEMSGIPDEYYQYLVVPKNGSPNEIARSLTTVIEMTAEARLALGKRAQSFIIETKNCYAQAKRIVQQIESIQQ